MKPWGLCGSGILGMGHAKSCSLATASVQGSHLPGPSSGGSWGARQPHRFWLVEQHRQCFLWRGNGHAADSMGIERLPAGPLNRQKATPAPSIAHLPTVPPHCPSKVPLRVQALLNPPRSPRIAPSCPCTQAHALLLPPHAALQASQILHSLCTPSAAVQ